MSVVGAERLQLCSVVSADVQRDYSSAVAVDGAAVLRWQTWQKDYASVV